MNISIYLAKVMGFYFIITGLFAITRYNYLEKIFDSLKTQYASVYVFALLPLILGLLLVVSHNVWVADWRVIITLLSWVILLGGIVRLFFLEEVIRSGTWMIQHKAFLLSLTTLFLLLGCFLVYKGFTTSTAVVLFGS